MQSSAGRRKTMEWMNMTSITIGELDSTNEQNIPRADSLIINQNKLISTNVTTSSPKTDNKSYRLFTQAHSTLIAAGDCSG